MAYGRETDRSIRPDLHRSQLMQNETVSSLGQICEGTPFGDLLTGLARKAETIVELGTWHGQGSTRCLAMGIELPDQRLVSVEIDMGLFDEALRAWAGYDQITLLCGRIAPDDGFEPYAHPGGEEMRGPLGYDFLRGQFMAAPNVLADLPMHIDLLLLDGGEWSSSAEMDILLPRCDIIALDDTHPARAHKNVRNRNLLIEK